MKKAKKIILVFLVSITTWSCATSPTQVQSNKVCENQICPSQGSSVEQNLAEAFAAGFGFSLGWRLGTALTKHW